MFKNTCLRWSVAQNLRKLGLGDCRTTQLPIDKPEKAHTKENPKNSTPNSDKSRLKKPYKKILHATTNIWA